MIIDEVLKVLPDSKVSYVSKTEDPRDYKVSFQKIKDKLGFRPLFKVPDGIRQIQKVLDDGFILNPDDPKYRNT